MFLDTSRAPFSEKFRRSFFALEWRYSQLLSWNGTSIFFEFLRVGKVLRQDILEKLRPFFEKTALIFRQNRCSGDFALGCPVNIFLGKLCPTAGLWPNWLKSSVGQNWIFKFFFFEIWPFFLTPKTVKNAFSGLGSIKKHTVPTWPQGRNLGSKVPIRRLDFFP